MASLAPPLKHIPFTETGDDGRDYVGNPWYDWALRIAQAHAGGVTATVTLAKITGGGTDGSLTIVNGRITAVVQPT